jgi:hypothetical protein
MNNCRLNENKTKNLLNCIQMNFLYNFYSLHYIKTILCENKTKKNIEDIVEIKN